MLIKANINTFNFKELNYFEHYNTLEKIEDKQARKLFKKINNKTCKFLTKDNNYYYILHKSTKDKNKVQLSYFKNNIAISDKQFNNYINAIKECSLYNYKLKEVI